MFIVGLRSRFGSPILPVTWHELTQLIMSAEDRIETYETRDGGWVNICVDQALGIKLEVSTGPHAWYACVDEARHPSLVVGWDGQGDSEFPARAYLSRDLALRVLKHLCDTGERQAGQGVVWIDPMFDWEAEVEDGKR